MPPRRKPQKKRLRPGHLGQDFGSSTSKISLSFTQKNRSSTDGQYESTTCLARVPLRTNLDDPERNNRADGNSFEFIALTALRGPGQPLITGRAALQSDQAIPLKTVFMFRAGIQRTEVLARLPGGQTLMGAVRLGHLTNHFMDLAVEDHFRLLRRMAESEAQDQGLLIQSHICSCPNYLCEWEDEEDTEFRYYDVEKYQAYYRLRMEVAWADSLFPLHIQWIMEGQAAGLYICEPFRDINAMFSARKMWEELEDLIYGEESPEDDRSEAEAEAEAESTKINWLNMLIVDNGSSSLGIQVQTAYFDVEGAVQSSQASFHQDWKPGKGVTGGSHLTNERVGQVIREQLESQPIKEGYVAELLAQYDSVKHSLDWLQMSEVLTLHTSDDRAEILITPVTIQNIFTDTFGPGLRLLEAEIQRVFSLGENFAIIFCGGSYVNRGLRRKARECLDKYKGEAQRRGLSFKYLFLADVDNAPTSAVSCGAALSAVRIPPVDEVLRGSGIGIQVARCVAAWKTESGLIQWDEEKHADFLLSKGCGTPPHIDYTIPNSARSEVRFRFVCDPNYYDKRAHGPAQIIRSEGRLKRSRITSIPAAAGSTRNYKSLPIGVRYEHVNGPLATYDLGFEAKANELPDGTIRFEARGKTVRRLAEGERDEETDDTAITVEVRCVKINKNGEEVAHIRNKRWLITWETHPASKLLEDSCQEVPMMCSGTCGEQLTGPTASICQVCPDTGFCSDCFDDPDLNHNIEHRFSTIELDV